MISFKTQMMDAPRTNNITAVPVTTQTTLTRPIPSIASTNIAFYNLYPTENKDSIASIGLTPPAYLKAFATSATNFLPPAFTSSHTTSTETTTLATSSYTGNIALTTPVLPQPTSAISGLYNPNAYTMTSHIGDYQQWPYAGSPPGSYNLYGYGSHAINPAYSYPAITNATSLGAGIPWLCRDIDSKRKRMTYSRKQLLELEKEFHYNHFLKKDRRIDLAKQLSLTERQIKIWFQNRRMKFKKETKKGPAGSSPQENTQQVINSIERDESQITKDELALKEETKQQQINASIALLNRI